MIKSTKMRLILSLLLLASKVACWVCDSAYISLPVVDGLVVDPYSTWTWDWGDGDSCSECAGITYEMGTERIYYPDDWLVSSRPDNNCINWTLKDSNGDNVADNYPLRFNTNSQGGWNI